MKIYCIELFLGVIVLSCQANGYRLSSNRLYLPRHKAYRDPGYEFIERFGSRSEVNYGDSVPHGLLVPYVERTQHLRTEWNPFSLPGKTLVRTNHEEPIVEPFHVGTKTNFAEVDKKVLDQLKEEDRNFIEANLTPAEREGLLAKMEAKGDEITLQENRFGGYSISDIATELTSGAGQFIGSRLAGPLGAQLGAAVGTYLVIAAAEALGKFGKGKVEASVVTNNGTSTEVNAVTMENRRKRNRYI